MASKDFFIRKLGEVLAIAGRDVKCCDRVNYNGTDCVQVTFEDGKKNIRSIEYDSNYAIIKDTLMAVEGKGLMNE